MKTNKGRLSPLIMTEVLEHVVTERPMSMLLVTCYLCKKPYKKPKILPCYHTFCEDCISNHTPEQGLAHHCKLCGSQSILPEEGASKLKENNFVNRWIIKIEKANKVQKSPSGMSESDLHSSGRDDISPTTFDPHDISLFKTMDDHLTCHVHEDRPGVNYCRVCHLVICFDCAKSDHVDHIEYVDAMQNISEESERLMLEQVTALEAEASKMNMLLSGISQAMSSLEENAGLAKEDVNKVFDEMEKKLCERRGMLLRDIEDKCQLKMDNLEEQYNFVKNSATELEEGIDLVNDFTSFTNAEILESNENSTDTLRNNNNKRITSQQIFLLHKQISSHLDELNNNAYQETDGTNNICLMKGIPVDNDFIEFQTCQNITKIQQLLPNTGNIVTCHSRPEMCTVSGECLTTGKCIVGQENRVIFIAKTGNGDIDLSGNVPVCVNVEQLSVDHKAIKEMNSSTSVSKKRVSTTAPSHRSPRTVTSPRSKGPNSTERTPLKDLFFKTPQQQNKTKTSPKSLTSSKRNLFRSVSSNDDLPLHQVSHINNGSYEISICPQQPGEYKVTISVCKQEIPQSPFNLQAVFLNSISSNSLSKSTTDLRQKKSVRQRGMKRPGSASLKNTSIENDLLLSIGTQGRGDGEFTSPQGVGIDHLGRILIADSTNQSVQVFSVKGKSEETLKYKFLYKFGQKGRGAGQLLRPTGVCGLEDGRIAVADYDNKMVLIFSSNGVYEGKIGGGKLLGPKGICVDKNGHLIVIDNKLCEIFVFQLNGKLITRFGSRGPDERNLAGPHYVAVNDENNLFVTDFYNHCVKAFTTSGDYLGSVGTSGEGCGQFNAPTGVAVDGNENLIVADWGNSRIQIFDKEGSFVAYVNTSDNPLYGPQDVAITKNGQIIVADTGNHCVKMYKYLQ